VCDNSFPFISLSHPFPHGLQLCGVVLYCGGGGGGGGGI